MRMRKFRSVKVHGRTGRVSLMEGIAEERVINVHAMRKVVIWHHCFVLFRKYYNLQQKCLLVYFGDE